MAKIDVVYHKLLNAILEQGYDYEDKKRDVKCRQISSVSLDIPLIQEFPLLTTKQMFTKGIVGELLWFLRGTGDIRELWEDDINIWNKDWHSFYSKSCSSPYSIFEMRNRIKEEHQTQSSFRVGEYYGKQWRAWNSSINYNEVDQIENLIQNLKESPMSRRHIVTAWNPAELDQTALPPCHWAFEIIVKPLSNLDKINISPGDKVYLETLWKEASNKNEEAIQLLHTNLAGLPDYGFTLKWHQRSVDTFLGLPFNIASYALLAMLLEAITGYKALNIFGDLSNIHIYHNHFDAVREQLKRSPVIYEGCGLTLDDSLYEKIDYLKDGTYSFSQFIESVAIEEIRFPKYESFPKIKAEMLAPK